MPRRRFEISTGVKTVIDLFVVEAEAGEIKGIGSGSPAVSMNDNPLICNQVLTEERKREIELQDYFDDRTAFVLRKKSPAAAAALDIAVWDLFAKEYGASLCSVIGITGYELETGATVDIKPPSEAANDAQRLARDGFRRIKIKVGTSVSDDLERVRAVRETVGDRIELFVDANGGYDFETAAEFWRKSEGFYLKFFEQPLPADKLLDLARLREEFGIPICGDESVHDEETLKAAIECEAVDMINLKLMKCGGLTPALEMIQIATDAGVELMTGCMGDVGISIAAAAHLSIAKGISMAELDSHLNIEPICDGPVVKNGVLSLTGAPGIGTSMMAGWQKWIM